MRVDLFQFDLPADRIANEPATPRESAKLLHVMPPGTFEDKTIADLPDLLKPTDVLVFNDTKVIPARLYGKRSEAQIEATLLKQINLNTWSCLIKNARRLKPGQEIVFSDDFKALVSEKREDGTVVLQFNVSGADLFAMLHLHGIMPLPPYIKRTKEGKESDKSDYQTIFAKHEGAVAAPTAGLHFTQNLLQALRDRGIAMHFVTLHVGGGTFLPVKVQDTKDHVMHAEFGIIPKETADALNQAKKEGRRIIPVGTTALRLLESAADDTGVLHDFCAETSIFMTPGYQFKYADALFTNFHLPSSTLFMLVCAFCGIDCMKKAYQHAIDTHYRFFSYGDACLLEKARD